jgi:hypothetical protein
MARESQPGQRSEDGRLIRPGEDVDVRLQGVEHFKTVHRGNGRMGATEDGTELSGKRNR